MCVLVQRRTEDLLAYVMRYSSATWDECDKRTMGQLHKLARGLERIIEQENDTGS
jgi:hypothetical protein